MTQPIKRLQPTAQENDAAMQGFFAQLRQIEQHKKVAKAGLDEALATITEAIRQHWSTGGGTRLRQIVWSIWNGQTFVGLFDVFGGLDYDLARAVAKLVEAQLVGALDSDNYLRRVLTDSGEFARYDDARRDTPEDQEVIYPPLPISVERLRDLANAAEAIAKGHQPAGGAQ